MEARIVINGASFPQPITGVQRYARELTRRLLKRPDVALVVPRPGDIDVPAGRGSIQVVPPGRISGRLGTHAWVNRELKASIDPQAVLWSPTIRAPYNAPNHIPTIHDLSPLEHPEWFSKGVVLQHRLLVPHLTRAAKLVIADSHFTKRRLMACLAVQEQRIRVVPCGVSSRFSQVTATDRRNVTDKYMLPDRFALSVASLDPRKNLRMLINAWASLPRSIRRDLPLLLTGTSGPQFARSGKLAELPEGVRVLGYIDDDDLPALYSCATLFAYPSVYEGFGLPPLEAMAAGTPVVAFAECEAVAEFAEGAALLVSNSATALADGLAELSRENDEVRKLAADGLARAAQYSWESASATLHNALLEASHQAPERRNIAQAKEL
jgi:glycosyltransferase involved in cell wall biosynthesis